MEELTQVSVEFPEKKVVPPSTSGPTNSLNDTEACPLTKETPYLLAPTQRVSSPAARKPSSKKEDSKGKKAVLPNKKRKPPFENGSSKQTDARIETPSEGAVEDVPLDIESFPMPAQCEQSHDQQGIDGSHSNRANSREHSIDNDETRTHVHTQHRQPLQTQGSLS